MMPFIRCLIRFSAILQFSYLDFVCWTIPYENEKEYNDTTDKEQGICYLQMKMTRCGNYESLKTPGYVDKLLLFHNGLHKCITIRNTIINHASSFFSMSCAIVLLLSFDIYQLTLHS